MMDAQHITIEIPRSGWVQERITGVGDWQRDLACPRVVVKQEIAPGKRLSVALVELGDGSVEIEDCTVEEWQEETEAPRGGYWTEGRAFPARLIHLVSR